MIIDFHTHMFPDQIAPQTLSYLADICQTQPLTDGTVSGLLASQKAAGIDLSVVLPIVTKPSQFASINQFAAKYQSNSVISFGSIHPDNEGYKEKLLEIQALGLKGIKLHPDYQEVSFTDIRYKRILAFASELDLTIVVHAGVDPKCPRDVHCTPQMAREVLDEVKPCKLVLAHMGGNQLWPEVMELLAGRAVYFDTGVVFGQMGEEQLIHLIRAHGTDKVLFGTDSPWAGQKEYVEYMERLPLKQEEKEQMLYKNAQKLLPLSN